MNWLLEVSLSNATLLVAFTLPFAYFAYHTKWWYLPSRTKLLDSILVTVSIIYSLLIALHVYDAVINGETSKVQFALLHLCPAVLAILIVSRSKRGDHEGLPGITKSAPIKSSAVFKPQAVNREIEKIGWDDVVVNSDVKNELNSVVELLKSPESAAKYGIALPKGILLSGPPGTGKTTIAKVMANRADLSFFVLQANDIVSKWVGDSEKNLTSLFESAKEQAPAVIFIDEIDALGKKRGTSSSGAGDNLLNHLLQLIDGVLSTKGIYIIGATNRPEMVDAALRRAGRLNRVIEISLPDLQSRKKLFEIYLRKLKVANDISIDELSQVTDGNSGADIKAICNQAGLFAYQREQTLPENKRKHCIISSDIERALELFEATEEDLKGQTTEPEPKPLNEKVERISWGEVIVDDGLKGELQSVIALLKDSNAAKRYGIEVPKGILLAGPPGTGKTTLAKVIANEAGLAFFALKNEEVVSKWVGDSEKNLSRLFQSAVKHSPSVIFIDEVDSIGKNRAEGNSQHSDALLNHLLQLMDGVIKVEGVYIIAATNRVDLVDAALKRGGRLNKVIQVPLPGEKAREKLFELYLQRMPLDGSVDFVQIAARTAGKSAADIKAICNQAGLNAFRRESASGRREFRISLRDLEDAVNEWVGEPQKLVK